jgi:hypothetical protein
MSQYGVFVGNFLLWQTKSAFSLPWTYEKCPVDCVGFVFLELL